MPTYPAEVLRRTYRALVWVGGYYAWLELLLRSGAPSGVLSELVDQVKTDPGCVKAAHQPCPKYDVQMDAEKAAVRQAVRLERVSGEREKQEAIELEEEESIFSKIMLF